MEYPFLPFVILRHTFEDEPERDHFDFLFETEEGFDPEARSLIGFRVLEPNDDGFMSTAERMEPHRRHYLTYEGPVSGGRGRVVRVRRGTAWVHDEVGAISIWYRFDGDEAEECVEGARSGNGRWTFRPSSADWSAVGQ